MSLQRPTNEITSYLRIKLIDFHSTGKTLAACTIDYKSVKKNCVHIFKYIFSLVTSLPKLGHLHVDDRNLDVDDS